MQCRGLRVDVVPSKSSPAPREVHGQGSECLEMAEIFSSRILLATLGRKDEDHDMLLTGKFFLHYHIVKRKHHGSGAQGLRR